MKLLSFLVVASAFLMIPVQAFAQSENNNANPCLSSDASLGDSAFWANNSLELYAQKNYEGAIKSVDACLNQWVSGAIKLQQKFNTEKTEVPPLGKFTESERKKIHENYILNDVSIAIWVKARSLEEIGQIDSAKKLYSNCIYLTHGRAWDPKGWFWSPSSDCVKRGRKLVD
jgi:tetratricopeptide (TPR) repeat protein